MDANILVVEDEAIVGMEIENTLVELGYSVMGIVNTGKQAIERVTDEKPDLILMDIRIKGGLDGIETASRIRSSSDIPIIFLTAHAEEEKLERAKLTLPFGYLLKPFQDRDLKVTVEMALYAAKIELERQKNLAEIQKLQLELENKVEERTAELQKAKEEAEFANQAKTDFLAKITHELRSPLHHILSFARFGMKKTGLIPEDNIINYFKIIVKSGTVLLNLVNDLLDLSKLESGKTDYHMSTSILKEIVDELVNEFSATFEEKEITVALAGPPVNTEFVGDRHKIGQVIRNLLANATNASPAGGRITISVDPDRLPVENENIGPMTIPALRLSIRDEGTGIPQDELKLIFDKFVQGSKTKNRGCGTGLGLAICREIIQAHRGQIWAENNSARGATFNMVLPCDRRSSPGNVVFGSTTIDITAN